MDNPIDVYGLTDNGCAWCLEQNATNSYLGTDTQGDFVRYHVCEVCYAEFAPTTTGGK